jgi:hypothetical protein
VKGAEDDLVRCGKYDFIMVLDKKICGFVGEKQHYTNIVSS